MRFALSSKVKFAFLHRTVMMGILAGVMGLFLCFFHTATGPTSAFIVKSQVGYSLVYWTAEGSLITDSFWTLDGAINFARLKGLEVAPTGRHQNQLAQVRVVENDRDSVLIWKFSQNPSELHLTFNNRREAELFRRAFLAGAYSPSPHGHSIYLVR